MAMVLHRELIDAAQAAVEAPPEIVEGNLAAEQVWHEFAQLPGERLARFREVVAVTPLVDAPGLLPGYDVKIKNEGAQTGGAYKIRGTLNKMLAAQDAGQYVDGIVVASTGNHANETAIAARALGVTRIEGKCPADTTATKLDLMRASGMTVDASYDSLPAALQAAAAAGEEPGMLFIHPYDDPAVIAGQGTVGLEAMVQLERQGYDLRDPNIEVTLFVPGGGGGLGAGNALAMALHYPNTRVVIAQLEGGDGIVMARRGEQASPQQFDYACRGAAVPTPGGLAMDIINDPRFHVEIMSVTKGDVGEAMELLAQYHPKPESAGALAMAAARVFAGAHPAGDADGKRRVLVTVTSGVNLAPEEEAEFRAAANAKAAARARQAFAALSLAHLYRSVWGLEEITANRDAPVPLPAGRHVGQTASGYQFRR